MPENRQPGPRLPACLATAAAIAFVLLPPVAGQEIVFAGSEELAWNRPEAWAMKYFGSVATLSHLGEPLDLEAGQIELGLEGGWVPRLSEAERTVGFIGTKAEDLNRTEVFGRVRASFGLPAGLVLTAAVVPPAEVDGVTPELYALSLGRVLHHADSWSLGLRLNGETGSFEGDLTCPREAVGNPDREINPLGCRAPSSDEMKIATLGLDLSFSFHPAGHPRLEPYLAVSGNYWETEFAVDARYGLRFDVVDRARLESDGFTWALTAGLGFRASPRTRLVGEIFYSPLEVEREPGRTQNDELLNLRALFAVRVR